MAATLLACTLAVPSVAARAAGESETREAAKPHDLAADPVRDLLRAALAPETPPLSPGQRNVVLSDGTLPGLAPPGSPTPLPDAAPGLDFERDRGTAARERPQPRSIRLRASRRGAGAQGLRPFSPQAFRATRAEANASGSVELFAEREGFTTGRARTVHGLEGGAALRLRERLSVTARYRWLDSGEQALGALGSGIAAPLLGVDLSF
jgi:hypothetical protein